MMNKTKIALVAALVFGVSSSAFAIEGLDGDNNPVPGAHRIYAPETSAYAQAIGGGNPVAHLLPRTTMSTGAGA